MFHPCTRSASQQQAPRARARKRLFLVNTNNPPAHGAPLVLPDGGVRRQHCAFSGPLFWLSFLSTASRAARFFITPFLFGFCGDHPARATSRAAPQGRACCFLLRFFFFTSERGKCSGSARAARVSLMKHALQGNRRPPRSLSTSTGRCCAASPPSKKRPPATCTSRQGAVEKAGPASGKSARAGGASLALGDFFAYHKKCLAFCAQHPTTTNSTTPSWWRDERRAAKPNPQRRLARYRFAAGVKKNQ